MTLGKHPFDTSSVSQPAGYREGDHFMKRMYVNLTEQQIVALKARAAVHGSPISEEIRRAVTAYTARPAIAERQLNEADISEQNVSA